VGDLDEYDGIFLGAGQNGLITQAYLARAGLKVLSIDRAQHAGDGLTTAEATRYRGYSMPPTRNMARRGAAAEACIG
jgi:phytoene dehydrogenase-like protein